MAGRSLSQLGDPKVHNLFLIADVNSEVIRWVNTDLTNHILRLVLLRSIRVAVMTTYPAGAQCRTHRHVIVPSTFTS